MKPAAYLRVSPTENKRNETIDLQRIELERFELRENIQFAEWYVDNLVSGARPMDRRPDGSRMLSEASQGKFDTLHVCKIDRLARNVLEGLLAARELKNGGIYVVSIGENLNNRTPDGEMHMTIMLTFAQRERERILERTISGKERIAAKSLYNGGRISYGFRIEDRTWVIDPDQMEVVERIYCLYSRGWSHRRIAKLLTFEGIPGPLGGKWNYRTIGNILSDPIYAGTGVYKKKRAIWQSGEFVGFTPYPKDKHIPFSVPAIVSVEDYRAAQELRQRHSNVGRPSHYPYMLSAVLRCECGQRLHGSTTTHGDKRHVYYRHDTDYKGTCQRKPLRADLLDMRVWEEIARWAANPGEILEKVLSSQQQASIDVSEEMILRKQLAELPKQRALIISDRRKGYINEEDLRVQLQQIEEEDKLLQQRLASLTEYRTNQALFQQQSESLTATLRMLAEKAPITDRKTRKEVVVLLIEEAIVKGDRLRLKLRLPKLRNTLDIEKCASACFPILEIPVAA